MIFLSPARLARFICFLALLIAIPAGSARALNYSVPFVRDGLPYFNPDGTIFATGYGATVGEIEVTGTEGNGIDGFNGHRQSGLGPNPGDAAYGEFGFVNVQDFSGLPDGPADNYFHGTFVAGIMASEYTSVSDGSNSASFLGVAPFATYYGAVFSGSGDKAGFLSLNSSLNYVLTQQGATVANNSWGSTVTSASDLDGNSATSLLMD